MWEALGVGGIVKRARRLVKAGDGPCQGMGDPRNRDAFRNEDAS